MKKMVKRALALGICVMLILSSVVFVSAASATFFTKTSGSHRCTGRGTVTGGKGQAVFNATALPGQQVLPDEAYACVVQVNAYNSSGVPIGAEFSTGDTSAIATYQTEKTIHHIKCYFSFNGNDFGEYSLYA